jgi:hypothetical protein
MITKTSAIVLAMVVTVFGSTAAVATVNDPIGIKVFVEGFNYKFDMKGIGKFANNELRQSILTEYNQEVYNIPSLRYTTMGHTIKASDVQVNVDPTRINDIKTRLDIQVLADTAQVTGPMLKKSYNNLEVNSISGIYDSTSDVLRIKVPYETAWSLLQQ